MARSVGKLFRPVVIEAELRELVDAVLIAPGANDPAAVAAMKRIREKASNGTSYLYAVEIRNYLEEKTRVGSEPSLFTLAGDLFLDALEGNRASIGPNFFKDHYSGVFGCYRDGEDRAKAVEGPLYCVDLALLKALDLSMEGQAPPAGPPVHVPAFVPAETSDPRVRVRQCLHLADDMLRDAVHQAVNTPKKQLPKGLLEYVGVCRERLAEVLKKWGRFLQEDRPTEPAEDYLLAALEAARQTQYLPLVAGIEERLGLRIDPRKEGLRAAVRYFYDAADLLVAQGNLDREADAFHIAQRRYTRALDLFGCISDRTAMAKALVEQARLYIRKGGDGEHIRHSLHKAVSLVVAHRNGLPPGRLPVLDDEAVTAFLESKGYLAEAKAYAEVVDGTLR